MKKIPFLLLIALILLCLVWETLLAPLRGGDAFPRLAIKALPLAFALPGFFKDQTYTYKWMTLLIWLYFMEGVVRGWSDPGLSQQLAWIEIALSLALFFTCVLRIRQKRSALDNSSIT